MQIGASRPHPTAAGAAIGLVFPAPIQHNKDMHELLQSLRWQDIADILIVAYIIYRVILLIRGTRAVQMLGGIAVLTVMYFAARELEFMTLYWLLGTALSSIFLIIIIIFQRDIRRALMQMGQAAPFTRSHEEIPLPLEEIVRAAVELARARLGALIVIECETGLKEFVDHGHLIDAVVSHELLFTLFLPKSPLHDGGIIISKGRLHAARCVLPLTKNPYISPQLGTRHRAAIGISEETDAVIIVVSEESNQVSIVRHGAITFNLDEKALRNRLEAIFSPREPHTMVWKHWLGKS